MFTTRFQAFVRRSALRLMAHLGRLPVTPNQLTISGLVLTAVAACLVALNMPLVGGLLLVFAAAFDILDGALARASGRSYAFGAFLDSSTDRISEGLVMLGVLLFFERHNVGPGPALVLVATGGSFLVSYVKARAESLGYTCEGGLLARPERVLLTVLGLLLTPFSINALLVVVAVLAGLTTLTVVQRVWTVYRQAHAPLAPPEAPVEAARPASEERELRRGPEAVQEV